MDSELDSIANEDIKVVEIESVDTEVAGCKRKRKDRSIAWKYFEKDPNSIQGTKLKCTCKKCNTVFVYDSIQGTGNLLRHKDRCYGKNYHDVGQMLFNSDMALRSRKFNQKTLRELLVSCTIRHELPLSFVEYKGVRDVIEYLEPNAESMTRNTLKVDLIEMFKTEKEKLKSMLLESPGMLCLTSDLWSSINTDGFLAITVHFIDKEWVLQKKVLAFSHMPPPHSGVALNAKVFSILEEWGLEKKIFCITLDNASSNDRFVQLLRDQLDTKSPLVSKGRFSHMRCCAHIVSRWNSTFLMLDSAIYYRKAFAHLEISDSNYTSCPSATEWDTIEKICVFLAVFYDVTSVFSGTKYPTANLYYPHVFMVYFTLHDSMSSKDEYMRRMGASMMDKFKKYWYDFNLTLAIAVVFDPRYKLHFIEWSYNKIYGADNCQYSDVELLLSTTFDEYVLYFGNASSTTSNHASTSSSKAGEETSNDTRRLFGVRAKLLDFDEFQSQESTTNRKSELQLYLEEPRMERTLKLDVLAFWKSHEFRYPVLARMARDFLTIPISTVASESTFSASGRLLNKHRSSLAKDTVEALVCTKDWLFGGCGEIDTDDLAEDIMSLSLEVSPESGASNSVNNSNSFTKV